MKADLTSVHASGSGSDYVEVLACCDENYARHFAVVLESALHHAANPSRMRFWLVSAEPLCEGSEAINNIARRHGATVEFVVIDDQALAAAPAGGHISRATYLRLLLPFFLPATLEKVIYLDCDVVVCRDLAELYSVPVAAGLIAGAVHNPRFNRWASLGMKPEMGYFNAGVLLLNLVAWRKDDLTTRALKFLNDHAAVLMLWDQDVLNAVIAGRWQRLDPRWNQQYSAYLLDSRALEMSGTERKLLLSAPYVVHYSGATKPWAFDNDHPLRHLYFRHLQQTPYADWRPKAATGRDWLKKLVWIAVPHRLRPAIFGW